MQLHMQNSEALTVGQIEDFLRGTEGVSFVGQRKEEVYAWIDADCAELTIGNNGSNSGTPGL